MPRPSIHPRQVVLLACALVLSLAVTTANANDKPDASKGIKHRITGLFSIEREDDLRLTLKKLPDIKLVSLDFESAEASFEYDAAKVFPNAKPEQIVEQFDNLLKSASSHTFGVKPLRSISLEKLKWIEISIVGLDCKGCCLAAYDSIYKLEGVEVATASFKKGRVTALIDPEKTDRGKLEKALTERGVVLKPAD